MKSNKLFPLIVTGMLAIAGFFILPIIDSSFADSSVVFAIGIILGGTTVFLLTAPSSAASPTITTADSDEDEDERQTLYVGNLPYRANETIVRELFEHYGSVYSVRLVKDKQTGRRRGFGFVTMNSQGAQVAMTSLNDNEFQERVLKVREAKDKTSPDNPSQTSD